MRRLILLLLISHALAQTSTTTQTQSVPGGTGTLVPSGTPTSGQIALWVNSTTLQGVSTLPSLSLAGTGAGIIGLTQGADNSTNCPANSFCREASAGITTSWTEVSPSAGPGAASIKTFTALSGVTTTSAYVAVTGDCTMAATGVLTCTKATGPTLTVSSTGSGNGVLALSGTTSGTATFTAPAVAGTTTNLVTSSNGIGFPDGAFSAPSIAFSAEPGTGFYRVASGQMAFVLPTNTVAVRFLASGVELQNAGVFQFGSGNAATSSDTGVSRLAAGLAAFGTGSTGSVAGYAKSAMTSAITSADVTCGTGGTISSCVAATTITGLTFTLPLFATNWAMDCDLVVGQATAATANQWLIQTATNGVTNTTASYTMATAATASAFGAVTDQASTTTAFQIAPSWTLGGTATKMPVHIHAMFEGVSVSGTVINLQVIAPTVGDLLTIYRGASCSLHP